jgi:hypothetical protein
LAKGVTNEGEEPLNKGHVNSKVKGQVTCHFATK